jgi:thymidylate synthase (FAD)
MRIIKPYVCLNDFELDQSKLFNIERAARLCYKSEEKMGEKVSGKFLKNILNHGHESVIEHEKVTAIFVVDRGITHEIVRHRIGSYSQESTRYCNYSNDKFGNEITVIEPFFYLEDELKYHEWRSICEDIEKSYFKLINISTPQEARTILPNSLKTEIAVTFNMREWRHFFKLRCAVAAHPQMQQVTIPLLLTFKEKLSPLFDDIEYNIDFPQKYYGEVKIISK